MCEKREVTKKTITRDEEILINPNNRNKGRVTKKKNRQADKAKKKAQKAKQVNQTQPDTPLSETSSEETRKNNLLPWALLGLSWVGFAIYWYVNNQ